MKSIFRGCSGALWGFVAILGSALACSSSAKAEEKTVDFEGLQHTENVGEFYMGGKGGRGSGPGPAYDVTFSPNANLVVYKVNGNSVLLISADRAVGSITMNVSGGFSEEFHFQYATARSMTVGIYDGLDGTGKQLWWGQFYAAPTATPYDAPQGATVEIPFLGTGRSVVFMKPSSREDLENVFALDNITFNSGRAPGLTSLTTSVGPIYPAFEPGGETAYSVVSIISSDVKDLTLTPIAGSNDATIQARINGGPATAITTGQASNPLPLKDGVNEVAISVETPGEESVTYTVRIARGLNQGPQGPPGPVGPQGPPAVPHVSPASGVYTLDRRGVRLVEDPLVTRKSVIYVQFIGGASNDGELYSKYITDGKFHVFGPRGRRFRYVVVN